MKTKFWLVYGSLVLVLGGIILVHGGEGPYYDMKCRHNLGQCDEYYCDPIYNKGQNPLAQYQQCLPYTGYNCGYGDTTYNYCAITYFNNGCSNSSTGTGMQTVRYCYP